MNKKITEVGDDEENGSDPEQTKKVIEKKATEEVILAKYQKKARDLAEQKEREAAEHKRRILKEKMRLLGRVIPTKDEAERERELQIIATKGVIQLFNAVSEF